MKARTLGTLGAVLVMAGACFGQVDPSKLKFNGVGLDSTYGQVVKALGKPSRETKPQKEECFGGRERNATYDGATFYFTDSGTKTFKVMSFDVTSAKYVVSGIKVGDSQLTVRRVLGSKFKSGAGDAAGTTAWTYEIGEEIGPGSTIVTFRKGKIVGISSSYMVC